MRQIMNKEPRYKEVVVDFVDRVHGTGFPEIRPWRPRSAIPVEFVDVVRGTDSSGGPCSAIPVEIVDVGAGTDGSTSEALLSNLM
jgi:hypothetical protein